MTDTHPALHPSLTAEPLGNRMYAVRGDFILLVILKCALSDGVLYQDGERWILEVELR